MLKVDLFVAGGTPLDSQQLARRQAVIVRPGVTLVHPPEDILLQKLRWYRLGGDFQIGSGETHSVSCVSRARDSIAPYLRLNAPVLGVTDLLNRLLDEAGG